MEAEDIDSLYNKIFAIMENNVELERDYYSCDANGNPSTSVSYDSIKKATEQLLTKLNAYKSAMIVVPVEEFLNNGGILKEGRIIYFHHDRNSYGTYVKYDKKQNRHYIIQEVEDIGMRHIGYKDVDFKHYYVEINVLPIFQ
jgi:hypothetical protein